MAGILDALRAFLNPPATVQRSLQQDAMFGGSGWETVGATSGKTVDTESALRSIAVQAAIRLLVNDIGSLPVDVLRTGDAGKTELRKPTWVLTPNPLNPNETWEDYVKQVVFSMLSDGNAFVRCFPSAKSVQGIEALDPTRVGIDAFRGSTIYKVEGEPDVLTPNEILHLPWVKRPGKARGLNPIEAATQGIGIALAADEFVGSYFGNGAVLSGIIEYPIEAGDPDPEKLKQLKADFAKKHVGSRKSHAVGALTGGAKFVPFNYSNRDAQLLELRQDIVEEVARLFGIPPHMLGSQRPGAVSYASVEQRSIDYVTHAVLPVVRRIEVGHGRLLAGANTYMRFNMNGLLRADHKTRWDAYGVALDKRTVKVDEVRALEDLAPLGEEEGGGFLNTPNNTASDPRIEAVGALIRAGFDPAAAVAAVGLEPIKHLGLPPVTVQAAEQAAPQEPAA